jgi:Concanavalin A-like lectin/glucanases superfamily/FG-GAP repeat
MSFSTFPFFFIYYAYTFVLELKHPSTYNTTEKTMKKKSTKFLTLILFLTLFAASSLLAQMQQRGPKIVATDVTAAAFNGWSAAINNDGTTAVSGAYTDASGVGAAFVYTRTGDTWTQQGTKLVGTGAIGSSNQGKSVAISANGNTIIVGGDGDNSINGAAWVFTRSGTVWSQQAKLIGTSNIFEATQGSAVALSDDGNTAAVGGYFDNSAVGAVWIFTRSGSVWTQQQKLVGTGATGQSYQGTSVSLSGDGNTVAIGGTNDNSNTGAVWVFTRSGATWTQQGAKIVPTDGVGATKRFGSSVSLSGNGNVLAFGGENDNGKGAAWVYTRTGGVWTQDGSKITGTDVPNGSVLGRSISMTKKGNKFIIGGAFAFNATTTERGAAYIFSKTSGTWQQEGTRMVGTGNIGFSYQAYATAISGNGREAIVGAPYDNTNIGATYFYKVIPSAIRGNMAIFNGSSEISAPSSTDVEFADGTIEFWVNPTFTSSPGYNPCMISCRNGGGGSGTRYSYHMQAGKTGIDLYNGSVVEWSYSFTAGQWYHISIVESGTTVQIFVNGVSIGTKTIGSSSITGQPFNIGSAGNGVEGFIGQIEEVRVWNTARTQGQIRENMHLTLSGDETGLVAYYQINESTGNAMDAANGNNASLNGTATRTPSTLSVSGGTSFRMNINSNAIFSFPNVDCVLDFSNPPLANPNGEVVVSKLNGIMAGTLPTGNLFYDKAYWIINNYGTNTGLNVYARFILGPGYISTEDATTPANLKLNKRNVNSAGAYTQINGLVVGNLSTGEIMFSNMSSFSEFAVSTIGNSTLPIKLVSFTGQLQNNNALLNWTISEAENNTKYELQRSVTAQNFATINTQLGNAINKSFAYTDNNLTIGNYYYRLKITNANGEVQYSNIVLLKLNGKTINISIYPNPIAKNSAIQISITNATVQNWKLINSIGQVVAQKNNINTTGTLTIDLPIGILVGAYQLQLTTNKGITNERVIIQ